LPVDLDVGAHPVLTADRLPPGHEPCPVLGHAAADQRHQSPAGGQAGQRLLDVAGADERIALAAQPCPGR
jgi:hypothetical protein